MFFAWALVSCEHANRHKDLTTEAFSEIKEPLFVINGYKVRHFLIGECERAHTGLTADNMVRQYYTDGGKMMWVNKFGVMDGANKLIEHLRKNVNAMGLSENAFFISPIEEDMERMRQLDFDTGDNTINHVLARLECHLMKAYTRYTVGQRYGFVNPNYTFNRLDSILTNDSTHRFRGYRLLYDLKSERPDDSFFNTLISKIAADSVAQYLEEIQPDDGLYKSLLDMLPTATEKQQMQIIANMERCRWRYDKADLKSGKTVVVNIPEFKLYAYDNGRCVDNMKVGCGATKTKTPILHSMIERIELNPQWHIPMSIITTDIVRHIGDTAYFDRNNYYIVDRNTGEELSPTHVSAAMLRSGKYRVSQRGGDGNSLGRIIFRFKNNVSVYLHDTNSRGFFNRDIRAISHGCVRVERPFDLARFVLGDSADEWTYDKIRISMDLPPETDRGRRYVKANPNGERRLISNKAVNPAIPVHILYFTMFPDAGGNIVSHPDIYGYDAVIRRCMQTYINKEVRGS